MLKIIKYSNLKNNNQKNIPCSTSSIPEKLIKYNGFLILNSKILFVLVSYNKNNNLLFYDIEYNNNNLNIKENFNISNKNIYNFYNLLNNYYNEIKILLFINPLIFFSTSQGGDFPLNQEKSSSLTNILNISYLNISKNEKCKILKFNDNNNSVISTMSSIILSKFNLSSKYPCKNINCLKFCGLFNINSKIFFVHQYLCNCNDTIINKLYLSDTTLVNNNGSIFINKNDNNIYEYNLSDIELINKLPYNIIITNITYCDLYKKLYILVSSVNKYTKCTNQGDEQSGKNPLLARTPPPEITDNSYLLHLQWFDVLNIFGNTLLFTNNETNDLFSLNNNPYGILSFFDKLIIFSDIINSSEKINDTSNDSLGGLNSCKYTILQILN